MIGLPLLVSRFSDSEVSLGLPTSRSDGILGGEFLFLLDNNITILASVHACYMYACYYVHDIYMSYYYNTSSQSV